MRIGLLQCDHVADELHHIAGDYNDMFARWFAADWRVYDLQQGQLPQSLDECDAWMATGSRFSVYDGEAWIHAFADIVRRLHAASRPFIGICFGHQMIGHALGGRVAKAPAGWGIGVHRFHVTQHEPWMRPPLDDVGVLMSCQDQVLELPPGATVYAGNAHCPVGIFSVGSLLGIQGHPEWQPEYATALLEMRRERIGPERVDRALATMGDRRDSDGFGEWVRNWVAGWVRSSQKGPQNSR